VTDIDESRMDCPEYYAPCLFCGAQVFYPAVVQATDEERRKRIHDQFRRHVEWNPDIHKFNDGSLWIEKAVNP
jgi:hypothetical protein